MNSSVLLLAPALATAPLAAQHLRPVIQVDTTTTGAAIGPSAASDGEASVILYCDGGPGGANTVHAVASDGRGLVWSAPIRLDGASSPKLTQSDCCWVFGTNVYAFWRDERHDDPTTTAIRENDLFLNVSRDGGAAWLGEALLPKGYPAGTAGRVIRDFAIWADDNGTADGGDDHLYVLAAVEGAAAGNEELYLSASHDGGASFAAAVHVPSLAPGTADVDYIALAAAGTSVHVLWQDNRNGGTAFDDVWHRHSMDGGAAWSGPETRLNDVGAVQGDAEFELALAVSGAVVIASWQEERASLALEELRLAVSTDGGASWSADVHPGSGTPGQGDADFIRGGLIYANGRILLAWSDDAGHAAGEDKVYVTTSSDLGATWTPNVMLSDPTSGGAFASFGRPRPDPQCLVVGYTSDQYPNQACAAWSRDGGATWTGGAPLVVSDNSGDADLAEVAYNAAYANVITAFLADDLGMNRLYVGGFRPQTLEVPSTVNAGQVLRFHVSNFCSADAGERFAVLTAAGTGSYLLPDGRSTGLADDLLLAQSLLLIRSAMAAGQQTGVLVGRIDAAGSGATANFQFPNVVPSGSVLHLAAIAFQLPPFHLGSCTDIELMVVQ